MDDLKKLFFFILHAPLNLWRAYVAEMVYAAGDADGYCKICGDRVEEDGQTKCNSCYDKSAW